MRDVVGVYTRTVTPTVCRQSVACTQLTTIAGRQSTMELSAGGRTGRQRYAAAHARTSIRREMSGRVRPWAFFAGREQAGSASSKPLLLPLHSFILPSFEQAKLFSSAAPGLFRALAAPNGQAARSDLLCVCRPGTADVWRSSRVYPTTYPTHPSHRSHASSAPAFAATLPAWRHAESNFLHFLPLPCRKTT